MLKSIFLDLELAAKILPMDQPFTPFEISPLCRWTGADVAASIPIGNDKYIWLFGDTVTGTSQNQSDNFLDRKRKFYGKWPRNTISLVENDQFQKVYAQVEQKCMFTGDNCADSFFKPFNSDRYTNVFWGYDGLYLPENDALYIFGNLITQRQDELTVSGNIGFKVMNPNNDPTMWNSIPFEMSRTNNTILGRGVLRIQDDVYIFGDKAPFQAFLSKITVQDLVRDDWSQLLYLTDTPSGLQWLQEPATLTQASELHTVHFFSGEATVVYNSYLNLFIRFFVDDLQTSISMFYATDIHGPYTKTHLFHVGEPFKDVVGITCYSVKIHPELASREDEVVITVNCQSDLTSLRDYGFIYVPIFYRLRF